MRPPLLPVLILALTAVSALPALGQTAAKPGAARPAAGGIEWRALSAEQKKQQLAALDAVLPEQLRKEREATNMVVRLEQQAQSLRAKGGSEDDVYRMRAKELDPEAAARLAEVDREEAAWKGRITRYLEQRNKLLQSQTNASESEREASLVQLQQSTFSEAERPRLKAYE